MHFPNHVDPPLLPERNEAMIFDDLLRGVEQSYGEVDVIFEANGLAPMDESPHINAQMRSNGGKGSMFLEVFASKLLPFDMHATGSAVWHHYVFAKDRLPFRVYNHKYRQVGSLILRISLLHSICVLRHF